MNLLKDAFGFHNPVKISAGFGALENVPHEIEALGASRPLVIADRGIETAGVLEIAVSAWRDSNLVLGGFFLDVPPDSGTAVVKAATRLYRERQCDAIIAIGGGSVIDTAKGVNILVSEGGEDIIAYSGAGLLKRPLKPFIVIPTTAGTGSEVTLAAVIRHEETDRKLLFISPYVLPDAAILDPRMTMSLPPLITAATGMDALTHAIEAFICLGKNPMSDIYAEKAISLISENIEHTVKNRSDRKARLNMAIASTLAGIAFSNSMVGLVHSLGHSAGAVCHVPHGIAMNIFLPHVLAYNMHKRRDLIASLLLPLSGPETFFRTDESAKAEETIRHVRSLQSRLKTIAGLPNTLKETGKVERKHLEPIAEATIDDASLTYNPEDATVDDAMRILEAAY